MKKKLIGCKVYVSVTFSWTSPLSDHKVSVYSLDSFKRKVCLSVGYRLILLGQVQMVEEKKEKGKKLLYHPFAHS